MDSMKLKYIAAFFMIIDHIGLLYFPENLLMRVLGRVSMPIFAYLLAIGLKNTHDRKSYIAKLFKFALMTQIVYVMGMNTFRLNILFTFLFSILIIDMIDRALQKGKKLYIVIVWMIFFMTFILMDAKLMDYGRLVLYLTTCFYYLENKIFIPIIILLSSAWYYLYGTQTQLYMFLSLPLLYFYNGKKGSGSRMFFYWFYPVHFLVLIIIRMVVRL